MATAGRANVTRRAHPYFKSMAGIAVLLLAVVATTSAAQAPDPSASAIPGSPAPAPDPSASQPVPPGPQPALVASGLANPRGITWDEAGIMYVAQSGLGSLESPSDPSAAVVRIIDECPEPVASGLPSTEDPFTDVLGPEDVAILDGQLYVLQGATAHSLEEMDPSTPNGVYAVQDDGTVELVADLTTWILANPTEVTPEDYNPLGEPYRMLADEAAGLLWVLEANRGEVLTVTPDGTITRVVDMSLGHPVLTGLALAPDGGVYVSNLTPFPHGDGTAVAWKVTPDGGVSLVWAGLTTATGLAVGPDGTLYAAEMATGNETPAGMQPGTGRIVRQVDTINSDVLVTGLEYPIVLRTGPDDALYAALPAYGPNKDSGVIIRIPFGFEGPVALDPSVVAGAHCPGADPFVPASPAPPPTPAPDPSQSPATPTDSSASPG
jgi:sugar lactone lactonase YvrE